MSVLEAFHFFCFCFGSGFFSHHKIHSHSKCDYCSATAYYSYLTLLIYKKNLIFFILFFPFLFFSLYLALHTHIHTHPIHPHATNKQTNITKQTNNNNNRNKKHTNHINTYSNNKTNVEWMDHLIPHANPITNQKISNQISISNKKAHYNDILLKTVGE